MQKPKVLFFLLLITTMVTRTTAQQITATPEQKALLAEQLMPFKSIVNMRQLGGYQMSDGRHIKQNILMRGGSLNKASDEELALLHEKYDLRLVFDFRTDMEVKHQPDREVEGSKNVWLPAIDPETAALGTTTLPAEAYRNLFDFLVEHAGDPKAQEIARMMYPEMVLNEYTQLQYAAFFQTILNTPDGSVYWHCSQGKDRTGIGAAFLLAALGADRELILRDYELSNVYYIDQVADLAQRVMEKGGDAEAVKVIVTFIGANVEYFAKALDLIDEKFGSMEAYLHGPLCLTDENIKQLRERFLE